MFVKNHIYILFYINMNIPKNDVQAWTYYKNYKIKINENIYNLTDLYSKLFVAQLQNINAKPMPIEPNKYPVVLRPIINLYGMGHMSYKINNFDEFNDFFHHTGFWTKYIEGDHYSIDLVFQNNKFLKHYAFIGHKNNSNSFGKFEFWEFINKNINSSIKLIIQIIKNCSPEFSGIINIELINNKIIEIHLRSGDLNNLPKDIVLEARKVYNNEKINKSILNKKINKIFIVPLWFDCNNEQKNDIYNYLENKWENIVNESSFIRRYNFDDVSTASPPNSKRWFLFVSNSKEKTFELRNKIIDDLNKKFK